MKLALTSALTGIALAVAALAAPVALAKEQVIGTVNFAGAVQRDVIDVGGREGQFVGLRMEARQSDVEVIDLKVVYGNGSGEDIRVRQTFKAGTSSRVLDLAGNKRAIRQIIVTYVPRGPAKLVFFGVEGAAAAGRDWERLGCKGVNFLVDRDTIEVGRKDGSFRRIKLRVRHAPVEFFDIRVIFGNGQRQDIRVRQVVDAGGESRAIDLAGESRGIQRVDLLYRSIPTFKGKAEVCVDGLQR